MLTIKAIKLSLAKNLPAPPRLLSEVRCGYQSVIHVNKNQPKTASKGRTMLWEEDIALPLYLNRKLTFEFSPRHQFGYNPEQLTCICTSSIAIANYKKQHMKGEVVNAEGTVIGVFEFSFTIKNGQKQGDGQAQGGQSRSVSIRSVLGHIDDADQYSGLKGYLQFVVDQETIFTPEMEIHSGELCWTENTRIPIFNSSSNVEETDRRDVLEIKLRIEEEIIGQCKIQLQAQSHKEQKYHRFQLMDSKGANKVGMLWIDFRYKPTEKAAKGQINTNSVLPVLSRNKISASRAMRVSSVSHFTPQSKTDNQEDSHANATSRQAIAKINPDVSAPSLLNHKARSGKNNSYQRSNEKSQVNYWQ